MELLLAALSGACFVLIGAAYTIGRPRGVRPLQIILIICCVSVVLFTLCSAAWEDLDLPPQLLWGAVLAGVTQYLCARLLRFILHHGPLSPLVCVVSMAFVPGTIYAVVFLNEPADTTTWLAVAVGVLCVLAGTWQQTPPEGVKPIRGSRTLYLLALLGVLLTTSVTYIVVKHLGMLTLADERPYLDAYRYGYMTVFYACIGLPTLVDLMLTGQLRGPMRTWLALGALASVGSIGGMWMLSLAAGLPGPVFFTVNNISQIVCGSTVSVLFFRERVSWAWYAMLSLGIGSVLLINL
jgi:drug/metabolite transporter (DMT)-like permease